jgi:hypothetical protein
MKRVLGLIPLLMILGCGDQKTVPFLGQWEGAFTVDRVLKGIDTPKDRTRHKLKGYVKIVLNKKSYKMHLQGEQQTIDIDGKWTYDGRQLTLEPIDVNIPPVSKEGDFDPNLKFIPAAELYAAYQKKLTFKLDEKTKTLTGLTTTIADLEGSHSFKKE